MRVWRPGEVIVHREVWRGHPRRAVPVIVVRDEPALLVTYTPEGGCLDSRIGIQPVGSIRGRPVPPGRGMEFLRLRQEQNTIAEVLAPLEQAVKRLRDGTDPSPRKRARMNEEDPRVILLPVRQRSCHFDKVCDVEGHQ